MYQEVDRHIPRTADMWEEYFSFIPSWRRDDIMISYSMPGGGIGAHVDNYDVFLIQGRSVSIFPSFVAASKHVLLIVAKENGRLSIPFFLNVRKRVVRFREQQLDCFETFREINRGF